MRTGEDFAKKVILARKGIRPLLPQCVRVPDIFGDREVTGVRLRESVAACMGGSECCLFRVPLLQLVNAPSNKPRVVTLIRQTTGFGGYIL